MNEINLGCEIVKDLIPLCSEGLCSDESRAAIEDHVKECESCRKLYAQLPEVNEPEIPVPDEGKTFRKVSRKLKNRLVKMIVLGVVLLFVLGGLGYLTIGQVMKSHGQQSFETVWQSIEVHRLAKMVASGDFDSYAGEASVGDLIDNTIYKSDLDTIRNKDIQLIQEAWNEAYGGETLSYINVDTFYTGYGPAVTTIPYSTAFVHFKSGRTLQLVFYKDKDGKYVGGVNGISPGEYKEAEKKFVQTFEFLSMHELYPMGWLGSILMNKEQVEDTEAAEFRTQILANHFAPEWHDETEAQMIAFYLKGYYITNFIITSVLYDKEKEMLYHDVTVEAADDQGSAVLLTRFYVQADGMIPAPEADRIYTDGCTDELAADLDALFG